MNYHIKKTLSPTDLGLLNSLIGEELRLISILPFSNGLLSDGQRCFCVELTTNYRKVSFSNDIVVEKDGDEYFQLKVNEVNDIPTTSGLKTLSVNELGNITDITVCRDNVLWNNQNDCWNIEADVAILFRFNESQILIKAIDSLAGVIAIYQSKVSIYHEIEDITSTWLAFKTDQIDQCYRKCLDIKQFIKS